MSLLKSIIKFYTKEPTDKQLNILNVWVGTFATIFIFSLIIKILLLWLQMQS